MTTYSNYPQSERKYHYWRGFLACAILFTAVLAILAFIVPAPDYTMTPEQYQDYIFYCTSQ